MTDGIIQQAFSKYISMCLSGQSGLLPKNSFEFQQLQQELIEKIKQELKFMLYDRLDQHQHLAITGHKLLGDYLGANK